jgi:peroxiredoxin family protein
MSNKVNVLVYSGNREQLQMASMIASVSAVSGSEVTVFLSMNALKYFIKDNSENAPVEGSMGTLMEEKNAPAFTDLFESAATLGDAKIFPCSMAMDIMGLGKDDLENYLEEPLGLTAFLSDAEEGQMYSF